MHFILGVLAAKTCGGPRVFHAWVCCTLYVFWQEYGVHRGLLIKYFSVVKTRQLVESTEYMVLIS